VSVSGYRFPDTGQIVASYCVAAPCCDDRLSKYEGFGLGEARKDGRRRIEYRSF
jgi:hypothetical protein